MDRLLLGRKWLPNTGKSFRRSSTRGVRLMSGRKDLHNTLVQAFCNLTSHKLQQKQFYLFHTSDTILYDIKKSSENTRGESP